MLETELSPTPGSLIAKIRHRDTASWDRFAKLYAPLVYHWAKSAGLQDEDAADVGQEVFQVVSYQIDSFESGRKDVGSFRSWLWGITRFKILDHFRAAKRQPIGRGGDSADTMMQHLLATPDEPPTHSGPTSQQLLLSNAVKMLEPEFDPRTWQAFWKLAINGQPARDIGDELNMTAKAVRQAKYRVIRKLRALLKDDFPDLLISTEAVDGRSQS